MRKVLSGFAAGVALVVGAPGIASAAYPPAPCTITIVGERGTVNGKPGILVDGDTTCQGKVVVPYLKFPGQESYTMGSARPNIEANGSFVWMRKTGKKIYVYVKVGDVISNRIIIPAK